MAQNSKQELEDQLIQVVQTNYFKIHTYLPPLLRIMKSDLQKSLPESISGDFKLVKDKIYKSVKSKKKGSQSLRSQT